MKNTRGVVINSKNMGDTHLLVLDELSKAVKNSSLVLPGFQRPSVWSDKERRELIVSLCMDVPIGSFLIWEYDSTHSTHANTKLRGFDGITLTKSKAKFLLIDGQQRLQLLSTLDSSNFAKNNYVQFEKAGTDIRPRVLQKDPAVPLDPKMEILVRDLAGTATGVISALDMSFQKMAKGFRANLSRTQIPVRFFEKQKTRRELLFVYQTCNLAGKGLTGEDYVEAALSFYYPDIAEKISKDLASICSASNIEGIEKKITRSVFLKAMCDEIYQQTSFTEARKWGLDILNLRVITTPANKRKKVAEKSTPLSNSKIKAAYDKVHQSMKKIANTFATDWQLTNAKCLVTNEIVMFSAFYRKHKTPTKPMLGSVSRRLMISMIRKSTTGGSTQAMTTDACNAVRGSTPGKALDGILNTTKLTLADTGLISKDSPKNPKSAVGIDSMMFQLVKLHLFRNKANDIFTPTHKIERSTYSSNDVDHFYPKKELRKHSSIEHRKNHIANYVIMSNWSNRSKGGKWPYSVIDTNGAWPKSNPEKNNWKKMWLPGKTTGGTWAQKPTKSFKVKDFTSFLGWRSKLIVKDLNKMLDEIETKGF